MPSGVGVLQISRWLLIFLLACPLSAVARTLPENLQSVGQAELSFLFFKIYTAELLNPQGELLQLKGPLLLRLTFHRDISNTRLLKETRKRLAGEMTSQQRDDWLDHLGEIWLSVEKGQQMAFFMDREGHGHFYLQGRHIGSLPEKEFSQAFLNIWLSEDSAYPKLTRKLRGEI